jgi:hypothetical protein
MKITPLVCFLLFPLFLHAQKNPYKKKPVRDSLRIYRKIEEISKKRKITHTIYQSVFRYNSQTSDTAHPHHHPAIHSKRTPSVLRRVKKRSIADYSGAIIRKVVVVSLDPAGYSITDTSVHPSNGAEKIVNFFHIKSRRFNIKNHLLFSKGDSLDPLKIKESERVIRTSNYIHDALITVEPINDTGDSVDVFVTTQDRWSISPSGSNGPTKSFTVTDNNVMGFGQQFQQTVSTRGFMDSGYFYNGSYSVPYIRNTFITAAGFYNTDYQNDNKGLQLSRSFYSPLTRWAGGLQYSFYKVPTNILLHETDSIAPRFQLNYTYFDAWNGWSFPLFASRLEDKRETRFITAFRYTNTVYSNTIPSVLDPFSLFQSSDTWLGTVGISKRKFYKDNYVYRFGTTEDVPIGFLLSFTGGIQQFRTGGQRTYTGWSAAWSGHIRPLYISTFLESGTYIRNNMMEQGILRLSGSTFTDLIPLRKWKLRQFLVAQCTYGVDRAPSERLTINNENGLRGFDSPTLFGSNKLLVYLQSQFYAPFSWAGFRFAPVVYVGMGMVGDDHSLFIKNQPYPFFALGVQVRNELLVFNTFQFAIGYYPNVPGTGDNIVKLNPLNTSNIQFRQLQIGEPAPVSYY